MCAASRDVSNATTSGANGANRRYYVGEAIAREEELRAPFRSRRLARGRGVLLWNNVEMFIFCESIIMISSFFRLLSQDRRILELEMRNNELVKHITLLQAKLFPRDQGASGAAGR